MGRSPRATHTRLLMLTLLGVQRRSLGSVSRSTFRQSVVLEGGRGSERCRSAADSGSLGCRGVRRSFQPGFAACVVGLAGRPPTEPCSGSSLQPQSPPTPRCLHAGDTQFHLNAFSIKP